MSRTFTFQTTVGTGFGVIGAATSPTGTTIVLRQDHTFGDTDIWRSTNGGTSFTAIQSIGWDGDGWVVYNNGHWLAGSFNSPTTVYVSTDDGLTWNGITNASGQSTAGAAGDGANTVVMPSPSNKTNYTLNNGASIVFASSPTNYFAPCDNATLWDGTQFVGFGIDSSSTNRYIFTASDFSSGSPTWTQLAGPYTQQIALNGSCSKFAHDSTLGYLVSGTQTGGTTPQWYKNTTLANLISGGAIAPMGATGGSAYMSAAGNGAFFIGDSAGNLWETLDGATWTQDTPNFAHSDYAAFLTYDATHNVYILFGSQGSVCTAAANITPTVTVSPHSQSVNFGSSFLFSATTMNPTGEACTWSVNGVVGGDSVHGTIANGYYVAPALPNGVTTVTVKATMQTSTAFDSATVTLVAPTIGGGSTGGVPGGTAYITGKFRAPKVFKPVALAKAATIPLRIYEPEENKTIKG